VKAPWRPGGESNEGYHQSEKINDRKKLYSTEETLNINISYKKAENASKASVMQLFGVFSAMLKAK